MNQLWGTLGNIGAIVAILSGGGAMVAKFWRGIRAFRNQLVRQAQLIEQLQQQVTHLQTVVGRLERQLNGEPKSPRPRSGREKYG